MMFASIVVQDLCWGTHACVGVTTEKLGRTRTLSLISSLSAVKKLFTRRPN